MLYCVQTQHAKTRETVTVNENQADISVLSEIPLETHKLLIVIPVHYNEPVLL